MQQDFRVLGIMSGTSLDGVDLALCEFNNSGTSPEYHLSRAVTIPFKPEWKQKLRNIEAGSAEELASLDFEFGRYLGSLAKDFLKDSAVDFISSHGHTIFHQPASGFTLQIGSGAAIAATSGFPVVCDFRSTDVALGGQGAPLVPIGDELLFSDFEFCLNLGGIANVSFQFNKMRRAYDICPVNLILNPLAAERGLEFDKGGQLARSGRIISSLLQELNELDYYKIDFPKSLGREWVKDVMLPIIEKYRSEKLEDRLHTSVEHLALMISRSIQDGRGKLLVTGGGAYNEYLIERLKALTSLSVVLPSSSIIEYKEALIFAYLGMLRWLGKENALSSVTGASRNSCGGAIYL